MSASTSEPLRVALLSIGNCPSLALRNLRRYVETEPTLAKRVEIEVVDLDLREFDSERQQSTTQWSFRTAFDDALLELTRSRPDLIGFSCYLWNTEHSIHLARLHKQLSPGAGVLLGGPDVGPRAAELLDQHRHLDFIAEGDGEESFVALLQHLLEPTEVGAALPGVHRRGPDGEVVAPSGPAPATDMARLRDVWLEEAMTPAELTRWRWPHLLVETQRGCPYQCSYCMYGKTPPNQHTEDDAIAQLLPLLQRGLLIEIVDPTFSTYVKRAKSLLRRLAQHEYSGNLTFEVYPDSIDEEMADLLRSVGTVAVGLGFQTISSEGLKAVRRPKNLQRFERAVHLLRERQIPFYVDIIYGLPATGPEDFRATVDYLYGLDLRALMVYRLLGLPGSPMMDDADEHGLVFSAVPPYELLRSDRYSLEQILGCERLRDDLEELPVRVGGELFQSALVSCGSVTSLIDELRAAEDPVARAQQIAESPGALPVGGRDSEVSSASTTATLEVLP